MSNPDDYPTQYLGQVPPQQPQQPQQPQAYYTYDQYGNPYLVDQFGNPLPQQGQMPPNPPQEPKQSKAVWAVLAGVFVLILLIVGGVTAWVNGWIGGSTNPTSQTTVAAESGQKEQSTQGGSEKSGGSESSRSPQKSTTQAAPTTTKSARPTSAPVPNSAIPANAAASDDSVKAGNFEKVWRGTEETSAPFANLVAGEYIEQRAKSGRDNVTVTVFSPVTAQNYEMTCLDNGVFVTCTGGNNAVVYIA